jgi:hypothetical protein
MLEYLYEDIIKRYHTFLNDSLLEMDNEETTELKFD